MATARELRQRIRSIDSTAQITNAMQMVAAAKMRRAQQATLGTRPFGRMLYRIQRHATRDAVDFEHPLLTVRAVRARAVIVLGTDKGFCGALNGNLARLVLPLDPATTLFIGAGKRITQILARAERRLVAEFPFPDAPAFADARAIAAFARELFLKRDVDQVKLVATRFINTLRQDARMIDVLPIGELPGLDLPAGAADAPATRFAFEPDAAAVLGYLFGHYLNVLVYRAMLEAKASEHSARMMAMQTATDNATELTRDLTLEYNNRRQGAITSELLEIAGGQADGG
jgi:F-type H+-transporting ATPase subunit gamma